MDIIRDDINEYSVFIDFSDMSCYGLISVKCPSMRKYVRYDIRDLPEELISKFFKKCNTHIANAHMQQLKVLVFCYAGMSRSVSICLAFLIKNRKMSYDEAFNHISSLREIDPNEGFIGQLIAYSKHNNLYFT